MTRDQAVELLFAEIARAEGKHPNWPQDRLRQVVVVAEEAGEALQAGLNIVEAEEELILSRPEGYNITLAYNNMAMLEDKLQTEMIHTGAMALRWLMNRVPLYAKA